MKKDIREFTMSSLPINEGTEIKTTRLVAIAISKYFEVKIREYSHRLHGVIKDD